MIIVLRVAYDEHLIQASYTGRFWRQTGDNVCRPRAEWRPDYSDYRPSRRCNFPARRRAIATAICRQRRPSPRSRNSLGNKGKTATVRQIKLLYTICHITRFTQLFLFQCRICGEIVASFLARNSVHVLTVISSRVFQTNFQRVRRPPESGSFATR